MLASLFAAGSSISSELKMSSTVHLLLYLHVVVAKERTSASSLTVVGTLYVAWHFTEAASAQISSPLISPSFLLISARIWSDHLLFSSSLFTVA